MHRSPANKRMTRDALTRDYPRMRHVISDKASELDGNPRDVIAVEGRLEIPVQFQKIWNFFDCFSCHGVMAVSLGM